MIWLARMSVLAIVPTILSSSLAVMPVPGRLTVSILGDILVPAAMLVRDTIDRPTAFLMANSSVLGCFS